MIDPFLNIILKEIKLSGHDLFKDNIGVKMKLFFSNLNLFLYLPGLETLINTNGK